MKMRHVFARFILLFLPILFSACAGMGSPSISDYSQKKLTEEARMALHSLQTSVPETQELRERSEAVLVFPDIWKAGLLVGGSAGNGVLFSPGGHVLGYYNASSISYGLQLGAQSFSEVLFLMTPEALAYLDDSAGWSIGAGPSVVVVDEGMAKDFSSTTLRSDVFAFVYGQEGLMAGIGIQGQKITKLAP